jgi:hypothetical protein
MTTVKDKMKKLVEIDQLISCIQSNLTEDLLKSEYREHNRVNQMFGHCYVATETLYHFLKQEYVIEKNFGVRQTDEFSPHHSKDENGITHWWLQDQMGNKLDLTVDQYLSQDRQPPYENSRKGAFLTKQPSRRSQELINRVLSDLTK